MSEKLKELVEIPQDFVKDGQQVRRVMAETKALAHQTS